MGAGESRRGRTPMKLLGCCFCFLQSKKERIIGFFTCLALGLICFGLVCGNFVFQLSMYIATVNAGTGFDSSDSSKIKKVCCIVHNGQSLQYEQVC